MRELARIQVRGETSDFERTWNARSATKIEYGVIAIYKDGPVYEGIREVFSEFAKEHPMSWHEEVEVEYTVRELSSFELLRLEVQGRAGPGDNSCAPVYAEEVVCGTCGRTSYRQVRDMVLDFSAKQEDGYETGYFKHDLCETGFSELVVSGKVKMLIEQNLVPGVTLRPIDSVVESPAAFRPYFQLLVRQQIGPLIDPTRIQRHDLCGTCGQYKQVLFDARAPIKGSEFYFLRNSYAGAWIMTTTDQFGRGPRYRGALVINQAFYRLLKNAHVTGMWVQPAYLVES